MKSRQSRSTMGGERDQRGSERGKDRQRRVMIVLVCSLRCLNHHSKSFPDQQKISSSTPSQSELSVRLSDPHHVVKI